MSEDFEILYSDSKESGSHHSHHHSDGEHHSSHHHSDESHHSSHHHVHIDTLSNASAENAYL